MKNLLMCTGFHKFLISIEQHKNKCPFRWHRYPLVVSDKANHLHQKNWFQILVLSLCHFQITNFWNRHIGLKRVLKCIFSPVWMDLKTSNKNLEESFKRSMRSTASKLGRKLIAMDKESEVRQAEKATRRIMKKNNPNESPENPPWSRFWAWKCA